MIKTVAELIDALQKIPQSAEPRVGYLFTDDLLVSDEIEGVEVSNGIVYIGTLQDEEVIDKGLTEEQKEYLQKRRAEKLVAIEAVIPGVATFDVPKD